MWHTALCSWTSDDASSSPDRINCIYPKSFPSIKKSIVDLQVEYLKANCKPLCALLFCYLVHQTFPGKKVTAYDSVRKCKSRCAFVSVNVVIGSSKQVESFFSINQEKLSEKQ